MPAWHFWQVPGLVAAAMVEKEPGPHGTHCEISVAPTVDEKYPAAQAMQYEELTAPNDGE